MFSASNLVCGMSLPIATQQVEVFRTAYMMYSLLVI